MLRALIASSSRTTRNELAAELERENFEVAVAEDGNEAIALAESQLPDLIICSMLMDKRSAFLVLERLVAIENPTPTIVLAGNLDLGNRHKTYLEMLGATVVDLNVPIPKLLSIIEGVLDSR